MDKFAQNIKNLLEAVTPYAWLLPVIGFAIIGLLLSLPSKATQEFAKNHWWQVILGTIVFMGAIYMGNWVVGKIVF